MAEPKRRSCASRLHALQDDFGLSEKELKQAVREVSRPREVKLPTFHEKVSKKEKMRRELETPGNKQRKYMIAYWYLEEYLEPEYSHDVYRKHQDFKDLIQYAYEQAMGVIQIGTYIVNTDLDPLTAFPDPPDDELDIPEIQWNEFDVYCKKHPLKGGAKDIFKRRKRFKKYLHKRRGRYYSKKRMRMYDPLFAMTVVDEKEMLKNLERITRENELRVKKFHEMLDSLVSDRSIGAEAMKKFDKQTKDIMSQHRKRLNSFMKQIGQKPTPVTFDFDDEPSITYDGWD